MGKKEEKDIVQLFDAFHDAFGKWILEQDDNIQLSSAIAFGKEYENLYGAVQRGIQDFE